VEAYLYEAIYYKKTAPAPTTAAMTVTNSMALFEGEYTCAKASDRELLSEFDWLTELRELEAAPVSVPNFDEAYDFCLLALSP